MVRLTSKIDIPIANPARFCILRIGIPYTGNRTEFYISYGVMKLKLIRIFRMFNNLLNFMT